MKLVIIRHGDTEWTLSRRDTGSTDLPLRSHGHRQAAALAPLVECLLSGQNARAFSSPLRRATTTAALALPGRSVTADPLVTEYQYGDYEGLTDDRSACRHPAGTSGATAAPTVNQPGPSARGPMSSSTRTS
jgi:broad specificity phosphatase PhoE